jgi:Uma2 family endonuclease
MATPNLIETKLMTADEFWLEYEGKPYELIRGIPVRMASNEGASIEMSPTGGLHQVVAANCVAILREFVLKNRLGYVGSSEGGYKLTTNPDVIRGTDASFISFARLPDGIPDGYIPVPPDLAVEVVSPHDRAGDILEKVDEYRAAGTSLVWVIYPKQRQVMVYHSGRDAQLLSGDDRLDGGDVLPGFSVSITELWPSEPPKSQS